MSSTFAQLSRRLIPCVAATLVVLAALLCHASDSKKKKGNAGADPSSRVIDAGQLLRDVQALADDRMQGRKTDTEGGARARAYVVEAFKRSGVEPFGASYLRPFEFSYPKQTAVHHGVNIVGQIRGRARPERYLVVTAHYDHLGVVDKKIYNGADDNASGVAALLAVAKYFREHPPAHSIIFAALDAEEDSGAGGRWFVRSPPVEQRAIVLNVNLDMVSHNERNELYAAGAAHYPFLKPYLDEIAARAPVRLLLGHDRPVPSSKDDWTQQSDHAAFHAAKIPFVYFGVEDHANYHKPSDDFKTITPRFFVSAVETILSAVRVFDDNLAAIEKQRS
ncbi:MAG TPA: M28 family peptidase [Pyrinomonadaceae bacterium]|jgi:Zn-dependent M28 family amino/carboxypeptidase|nr:M28 family peptidase [Pyrinomonadaceae bacterium]